MLIHHFNHDLLFQDAVDADKASPPPQCMPDIFTYMDNLGVLDIEVSQPIRLLNC